MYHTSWSVFLSKKLKGRKLKANLGSIIFSAIILFRAGFCMGQTDELKLFWQIGIVDNSAAEFALFPDNFNDFVPEGFGNENYFFTVGESIESKNWPFVLPGPRDNFAGYSYWAGVALHKLPIFFELKKIPSEGVVTLLVDILEVSTTVPPLFRAYVNGKPYNYQLQAGRSGTTPDNLMVNKQVVEFCFDVRELKNGINEIVFQNMTGSWCAFDAIRLRGPEAVQVIKAGNTIIRSVEFADFEMDVKSKKVQPLLVELLKREGMSSITVVVDDDEISKDFSPGHSILEFYFPAVETEKDSDVKIYLDNQLKYENRQRRFPANKVELSHYVDQFMGTSGSRWMITPGPRQPMPMIQLGPNNQSWIWKAGYEYQIENISGFNHTQEWTMAGFLMMPTCGVLQTRPGTESNPDLGYRSRIDKSKEKAVIGMYSVDLTDYNIHVDLTATTRAGFQRYIFPESQNASVLIDAFPPSEYTYQNIKTKITRISSTKIEGWVHHICNKTGYMMTQDYRLYFVLEFNKPFMKMGGWTDKSKKLDKEQHGVSYESIQDDIHEIAGAGNIGAFVRFKTSENDTLLVRSSISLVSTENAWLNLQKEIVEPFNWNFGKVVQNQKEIWNQYLGRIEIETDDYLQKVKFYTNLYRAFSGRTAWGDVNGEWVDANEQVQTFKDPEQRLCSGEFWNTFWNVQQLYQLAAPEFSSRQAKSLIEFYEKNGWLSKGIFGGEYSSVMVAEHGIPWIVGAWNAGIKDFDFKKAYQAMFHAQTTLPEMAHAGGSRVGNESLKSYIKCGYVPLDTRIYQSYVSNTLEYAFDDWSLAQAAKVLGKNEDFELFLKRSNNWKNIFDPECGFMRPKMADGTWYEPFSPYKTPGFVEGNSWQFSWFVPQDMKGLVAAIGKKRFITRLDEAMSQSQKVNFNALGDNFSKYPINHGNQPNMQSCYLFNYADAPWLTQKWSRAIQEMYYGTGPRNAYPGDEDQGQMSAWYVMSTLGLFQMDGGAAVKPYYELGSPRFAKITIHLSDEYYGGKTFVIEAKNASKENKYIHSAILNGKNLTSWRFGQKEVVEGGRLILEMKSFPNKNLFMGVK